MKTHDLNRLQVLAQMVHDHELARTSRLSGARATTREKLDQLAAPVPLASDPALFAARQAHLQWAAGQRMMLNQRLALETARLIEQRRKTARSLGRLEALKRLRARTAKG
ncbi:MAG: hypothetical protein EA407_10455 [Rhodobacteraceae bacterium]|nr:MAG: hypothetical protein EA407_10455 [Paracoccaceae bacterium]